MKTKISEVLRNKDDFILTTDPETTARDALAKMEEHNVGSILVLEDDTLVGIYSERDYIRRIVLNEESDPESPVKDVMSTKLVVVEPNYTIEDCMSIMTSQRIRHLPVMEGDDLVGILSIGDLVKKVSEKAQARVRYLEQYISGEYPA